MVCNNTTVIQYNIGNNIFEMLQLTAKNIATLFDGFGAYGQLAVLRLSHPTYLYNPHMISFVICNTWQPKHSTKNPFMSSCRWNY